MRYAISRYNEKKRDDAYRYYITDSIFYYAQNKALKSRFYDLLNMKIDNRSGDEIAADVISRAGLSIKGSEDNNGCI